MAQFTWTFDAPTGVYKQHTLSRRLYQAALEDSTFMDHVRPVDGFGKGKGESVTLTRIANVTEPTNGRLSELDKIPEDTFSVSTLTFAVSEWGRAVPFTSFHRDLAHYDIENPIQSKLREQMKLVMDTASAAAFKTAKVKYAITGLATSTITTNGTFGATSSANMNLFHVEEIRDYLYDTLQVPMIGDSYIGIFRTLGLRGIKRDPAWEEWQKYTNPQAKYNSEVGRLEDIRFIETNHNKALGKVGTGSVLGEGVVFGQDAVVMAEAQTPELRAAIPSDFGRSLSVAWYGILEYSIVWDTGNAGEARIVHVGSV